MKIAILAPPWIALPPEGYGGTERVIANLTDGLVKKGHEVMLFATGDSKTAARLEFYHEKALGNNWRVKQNHYLILQHIHKFLQIVKNENFDIIHNHASYTPLFFLDLQAWPFITTLHGAYNLQLLDLEREDDKDLQIKREILDKFRNQPFISISNQQRLGFPQLNYIKTVYNGIDPQKFRAGQGKGGYLTWLGRASPKKGLNIAIDVATKTGIPLKIAAFVDELDKKYFDLSIKPLIEANKNIEFVGELRSDEAKNNFFAGSIGTLFPLLWDEPFGIVMIESMACGTPVIAFNKGSVPEVIEDGKTGFIVETEDEMLKKVSQIENIDRNYCYQYAISRFSVEKMVDDYLEAYKIVLQK